MKNMRPLKLQAKGRDMGRSVEEAMKKVNEKVTLKRGYKMALERWLLKTERAQKRPCWSDFASVD